METNAVTHKKINLYGRQNQLALLGYSIICVIMLMSYGIEYTEGNRSLAYMVVFSALLVIPFIACLVMFIKDNTAPAMKYVFLVGYLLHYAHMMFTGSTTFVFAYILPQCILFMIYCNWGISIILSIGAFCINFTAILYQNFITPFTASQITEVEIQLIVVLLQCIYMVFATRFFEVLCRRNKSAIETDFLDVEFSPLHRQNWVVILAYITMSCAYMIGYLVEVYKGNYTVAYFGTLMMFLAVPLSLCAIFYKKNPDTVMVKYCFAFGFLAIYIYSMLTSQTTTVFCYIFVLFIMLSIYSDMTLASLVGVIALFINILKVILSNYYTPFEGADVASAEVQLIVIILCCVFSIVVSHVLESINAEKLAQMEAEREKAEAASRSKSEFLSNMSHEIRTPLNAIIGMNEMILRETESEDVYSYATTAQNSSNALLALINDILDISKIEAGKFELVLEDYDVSSLFVDSYNMVSERARAKDLELRYSVDPTIPSKLHGDMTRVRQIFINLLTNAIKYTPNGFVDMSITGEVDGDNYILQMCVKDSGIGMTEENVANLFNKFERFDMKKNRNIEGTGLGMSITKEFIDMMNGNIHVESEIDVGTTFTVNIPQPIVDASPVGVIDVNAHAEMSEKRHHKGRYIAPDAHILVVDDVSTNHKVFKQLLKATKVQIDSALSGFECLELTAQTKYDVIFMDHMMPEMDGIETLGALRGIAGNPNAEGTPVIMLTANAISGEREKYLAAGFNDYLTKPIRVDKLEKTLWKYLPEDLLIPVEDKKPEAAEANIATASAEAASAGDTTTDSTGAAAVAEEAPAGGLGSILGMHLNDALAFCMGSEEFLTEMLNDYATNGRGDKLVELYAAEDWPNYKIEVHALKSTSRTVGFNDLGSLCEKLEFAARDNDIDYVKANHDEAMELYVKTLDSIHSVIG